MDQPETSPTDQIVAPVVDRSAVWYEIAAVLAVGVVPHLFSALAFSTLPKSQPPPPFLIDKLLLSAYGCCTIYVVLYLIHRSGEPWKHFGVVRPRLIDFFLGIALFSMGVALPWLTPMYRSLDPIPLSGPFSPPEGSIDYVFALVAFSISALSEELITRAYLITRLRELLHSQWQAIILAALMFGSYHIYQGISGLAYTVQLGLFYGVAYVMIRRVWPLAFGHMLMNLFYTWASTRI
jgi:membrane protease YdiL (CAAX protease family)